MSALGPKEASMVLLDQLEQKGIRTAACLFRQSPTPSSYIIQSSKTGSRTIISNNIIDDITLDEFSRAITQTPAFVYANSGAPLDWIHFEGRNVVEAVNQMDWLHEKASREGWRSSLTISVELEKPDRENIDAMMSRGDVVFFSKLFAERRGYGNPHSFLRSMRPNCKPDAILFCTWGSGGAFCLAPDGAEHHGPAIKLKQVIDPVGAGDTFIAGVIASLLCGKDLMSTTAFACEIASRKVAQEGFGGLATTEIRRRFDICNRSG
ncbi:Ribokinase-like protein [Dichotomocladium elegans]|nr:Ribokinase-like protein [Dichotomocladium elegans]